jgi:glycerol kinase
LRPGRRWEPRWSAGQRERGYAEWKKAVQRASHWSQVPS